MDRPTGDPWNPPQWSGSLEPQERLRLAGAAVQRLAELGIGLADVRQALVEQLATLPIEESWTGFERPLGDLDRIALQLDALYTELAHLLGLAEPPL
jgi:hypothetical protein